MRPSARLLVLPAIAAILVAACGGAAAPTPSPSPEPPAEAMRLRLTTTQAIPPIEQFGWGATVAITGDLVVVTPGAVPAIYPGPLVTPLWGRLLSGAGWADIVRLADELELLVDGGSFAGDAAIPGAVLGRVEILVDGRTITFTGDPNAQIMCVTTPCDAPPGTPAAFGAFWRSVSDLGTWMPNALGPEAEYIPDAYALLVGPAPVPEPGLTPGIADWPLETPLATLGGPIGDTGLRCAIVAGDDADTLRPALLAANQLTQWVQDPETSATFGLRVASLLPGDDPCATLFGLE